MAKDKMPFARIAREFISEESHIRVMTKNAYITLILLSSVADQSWVVRSLNAAALAKAYGVCLSNFYEGLNTLKDLGFVIADSHNVMLIEQKHLLQDTDSKGFIKVPLSALKGTNFSGVSLRAVRILIFLLSVNLHKKTGGNFKFKTLIENCCINRPSKVKKALLELQYILKVTFNLKDCLIQFKEAIKNKDVFCPGEYFSRQQKTYRYFQHTQSDYKTLSVLARRYNPNILVMALKDAVKRATTIDYFGAYIQIVCENLHKQIKYPAYFSKA